MKEKTTLENKDRIIKAKKEFWTEVFPAMFDVMNHYNEAVRILDNGSVVDNFIEKLLKEK